MKVLSDVVIPLITPLTEKDEIDVPSLKNLTEYLIEKKMNCLYPCGTTGEMVYLSNEERKVVVETVVKTAAGRVPVFAHVGAANTADTIELAKHAAECGSDGIGIVTPWFYKLSDQALIDYYIAVSQSIPEDFPIYLYAIPQNAVNDLNPETVQKIANSCPNVTGIKYSYPDMTKIQKFMTINDGNFSVLAGPDHFYHICMAAGGKGVVSGNAMVIPEHYEALTKAIAAGDNETAVKIQKRTNMLNEILCEKNNIGCYKVVLKANGIINTAKMRAPMEEVSADDASKLLEALNYLHYNEVII